MIQLERVCKTHRTGDTVVQVLNNITLSIRKGEFVAIMGPSGSGKSTLLNILGCLDTFDSGMYSLAGTQVDHLTEDELAAVRSTKIGFVFQSFHLINRYDSLRNVELPMLYTSTNSKNRTLRALKALQIVGLQDRIHHTPIQLSGGQQQRVAIARALVNNPEIILADEPTGNLDSDNSSSIMTLFRHMNRAGKTVIIITHDPEIAAFAERTVVIRDGIILN